ncbi:MAG: nitroreductase [Actinomycetia bacterium]|nr:nitroreductase [Actinomycetes bacterium]
MPIDLDCADHLLTSTRAVRKRLDLDRPVPDDVILECLRIGIQAPTASNSQGWRFVVVTDPGERAALADIYRKAADPYLGMQAGALGDIEGGTESEQGRVLSSAQFLSARLQDVPVHVIPCVFGDPPIGNFAGASLYGSIFPAVWSFQLALRARGLGSALTTLHLAHEQEAAALLGIPDGVLQVGLIPVAYFTGDDFKPAARRPIEEITYWNQWKNPPPT